MKKPESVVSSPYYDYFEVRDYLKSKHPHLNEGKVWRWLCDRHDIFNGSYIWLNTYQKEIDEQGNGYIQEFLQALQLEYGEGNYKMLVEW